jgi:hypothetical protein
MSDNEYCFLSFMLLQPAHEITNPAMKLVKAFTTGKFYVGAPPSLPFSSELRKKPANLLKIQTLKLTKVNLT